MLVIPDILELEPQNTIVIVPPAGSVTGQSDSYQMIVKLTFHAGASIKVFWELTIINHGFYRFANRQSEWTGSEDVFLSDKSISIPFVIQNISNLSGGAPSLEIQLGVFEEESGEKSKKFDLASIAVSYEPIAVISSKMLI